MDDTTAPRRGSGLPTAIAAVLAVALVGAGAYITQLRDQLRAAQEQLAPLVAAAKALYPDADPATALGSIAERVTALAKAPAPRAAQPVAAAAEPPAAPVDALSTLQEDAMVAVLQNEVDSGKKAWFLVSQNNGEAQSAVVELQAVFEKAGWPVETVRAPYPVKAGIFMLAGDETPPAFVDTVHDAFSAGGVEVQYLTGYRDFYKGRQTENPNWVGPTLADDQPFTIVVGSRPQPKLTEAQP